MAIIEVEHLSKTFKYYKKGVGVKQSIGNLFHRKTWKKEAVNHISFEIEEGEIVGFLGPNGAGKTTTLKMLSGILYPTDGKASVMGYIPWERKKDFKRQFSIVMGQKSQLWWDLPANESFFLNKHIYEVEDGVYEHMVSELAELLDVKELLDVQVRRLSLGERMKMEIIASLLHQPKVIFLDEPTIGLDMLSQKKIREFMRYYNEQTKTTVILTSHYMHDIEDLCKRAIIINQGHLVYDGKLREVNGLFAHKKVITLQFETYVKEDVLAYYGVIKSYDGYDVKIEVDKQNINQHAKDILDRFPVVDFTIEDMPIEEGIALLYDKEITMDSNHTAG